MIARDENAAMSVYQPKTLAEGIKWIINPGSGDFPVGQLDAQKRFPKGRGTPSFASSKGLILSPVKQTRKRATHLG